MNSKKTLTLKILGLFLLIGFMSCNSDEDPIPCSDDLLPLVYDPLEHLYGTSQVWGLGEWEVIIDPITGQFDSIPGTKRLGGGFSFPIGTTRLISFEKNQRLFLDEGDDRILVMQDLSTSEYTTLMITDPIINKSVIFPQFLFFGNSEDQIFLLDTDKSLWEINIQDNTVEKIINNIVPSIEKGISNIFYLKDSDDFVIAANLVPGTDPTATELLLYDNDVDSIVDAITIEKSFGFVQSPIEDQIFFLQAPTAQVGFRLMSLNMFGGQFAIAPKSTSDLAIDNISSYLQTIHSGTNSYICRGGSNSLETPTNFLYKIDLATGKLLNEAELTDAGFILSLSSE